MCIMISSKARAAFLSHEVNLAFPLLPQVA
jgi:hypothetical protein